MIIHMTLSENYLQSWGLSLPSSAISFTLTTVIRANKTRCGQAPAGIIKRCHPRR